METINGISFENWAAACGQLTQGMEESKILEVLGIEMPVWQDTMEKFTAKLAEPGLIAKYTEIFSNPNIGPFASGGADQGDQAWMQVVPDHGSFIRLQREMGKASENGVDAQTFLQERGLNIGQYSQASMHYMKMQNEMGDQAFHNAYMENSFNLDMQDLVDKYFSEYETYLALQIKLDEAVEIAEKNNKHGLTSEAMYAERECLEQLGVDQNLNNYLIDFYNKWTEQKREEMGDDAFFNWQDQLIEKINKGEVSIPNVEQKENEVEGITDNLDF